MEKNVSKSDAKSEGTGPRIERHPVFDGLRIVDPIERAQFTLLTPSSVRPTECGDNEFYFPVETTATVHTSAVETPYQVDVWIRDTAGDLQAKSTSESRVSVPPGSYNLEISSAGMKLYLAVESAITVESREDRTRISFPETRPVSIGVRSFHEQPAATVTTTDDPVDLMDAISVFGSALKTTSCERSFPTLRGHPPLLERGDELSIPEGLDPPGTGVSIEVPPELSFVYPVAPLSYYLGATVECGPKPRLLADGDSFSLTADDDFESTVARVLKQLFLLDCVTRTEGYYTVDLYEQGVVEEAVDLDFPDLYDRPLAEQVRRYLSVPYEAVAVAVPRWKLTADVVTDPANLETLPFLANDLAVVRCPTCRDIEARSIDFGETTVSEFFGEATRSLVRSEESARFEEHVFRPLPADSIGQTYVGEGIPMGASKMNAEAYRRRLEYDPVENTRTSVTVVCNEEEMNDENVVSEIYGTREWLEFDITIREDLTTEEMAAVLREDADFLHYIGHVDDAGIRCADGWLDTNTMDSVNVTSFLLNACKSYAQGRGLVEAGALGGIVTVTDVLNTTAAKIGRTTANLVDTGFSLLSALEILEKKSLVATQYLVIGDGTTTVVESESGTPNVVSVQPGDDGDYRVSLSMYPSERYHLGTLYKPFVPGEQRQFLNSGYISEYALTEAELREFLSLQKVPVELPGGLTWSETVCVSDI